MKKSFTMWPVHMVIRTASPFLHHQPMALATGKTEKET